MSTLLDPTLATYFTATNTRDLETLLTCFSPDAVVEDEAENYHGLAEIRGWFTHTVAEYAFLLEVIEAREQQKPAIVTAQVSGTFPGSPTILRFYFTLREGQIESLAIRP